MVGCRLPSERIATARWGRLIAGLLPLASLLTTGCMALGKKETVAPPAPQVQFKETPTAADLVRYLDRNAAKLPAVEADDLDIDIKAGSQTFGVSGALYIQQPKNFRLRAKSGIIGKVADVGSNDQEFWFWVHGDKPPYLYHCTHADLARGVRLPFPVQPEWVMEALGLARRDQSNLANFRVERQGDAFELIEQATSPQGQPVQKVTVFKNPYATGSTPHVVAMKLLDANGKPQCVATIESVHRFQSADGGQPAVLPHRVKLEWPAYQMSMKLIIPASGLKLNGASTVIANNRAIFARPNLDGVRSYDLARQAVDPPGIERTRGSSR